MPSYNPDDESDDEYDNLYLTFRCDHNRRAMRGHKDRIKQILVVLFKGYRVIPYSELLVSNIKKYYRKYVYHVGFQIDIQENVARMMTPAWVNTAPQPLSVIDGELRKACHDSWSNNPYYPNKWYDPRALENRKQAFAACEC